MHYETEAAIIQRCIPLFTNGQGEVPMAIYDLFVSAIKSINIAIKSIIPDLQIELEKKMEVEKEDGKKYVQVEVYSKRDNRRFLTKFESEGIKRIISLLSYLVSAYNQSSVCLVVDELDSIGYAFRKAGNLGKEPVKLQLSEKILKKIEEEKRNTNG